MGHKAKNVVRRAITSGRLGLGSHADNSLDFLGAMCVNQVLSPRSLRAAAGARFAGVMGSGSTFLAPVTAYPTTTLTMALWNGDPAGGRSYFIDRITAVVASGTPVVGGALLACVTTVAQARPTLSTGGNGGYANTIISGLSGYKGGSSNGILINAITLTGDQPAWFVAAHQPSNTATANIAATGFVAELDGGVLVPPGYMLGMAVLSAAGTTPLYSFGVTWDEVQADNE